MGGGGRRPSSVGHVRLSAPGRGEHRPPARSEAAHRPRAHAAVSLSSRPERGGPRCCHPRALSASLSAWPLDQRLRSRRRQLRATDGRLQRDDRRDGGRHRCRGGSRPSAVLHLAARSQRLQGGRGAEACGRPRRHLSGDGGRPRLAHDHPLGALAGDAHGRRARGRGLADRQSAAASAPWPHRPAQSPQDRGHRRSHHLLRQPELCRSGVPGESEVCAPG